MQARRLRYVEILLPRPPIPLFGGDFVTRDCFAPLAMTVSGYHGKPFLLKERARTWDEVMTGIS